MLERREPKKTTKMKVYNTMVIPTLMYGCETWTMSKRHESRLQATKMAYLRSVEGVTRMDRIRNDKLREAIKQESILEKVKR